MATAYIVSARTDMENSGLQVLDLKPNTSQRNLIYDGQGQTSYLTWTAQNDTVVLAGAGPITTAALYRGMAAYLVDRVQNRTGGAGDLALVAAEANSIATSILARVVTGQSLLLADINVLINAPAGVAGSDLDGTLGTSTGSVEDILKICQGWVYRLPTGSQVADAVPNFDATIRGAFAVQADADYQAQREFEMTGALRVSLANGVLSHLTPATFVNLNPALSYAAGNALRVNGTDLPVTGVGRAVVVYDALGNLL
jgi:hypothetical protein